MRRVVVLLGILLAGCLLWQAAYSLYWPITHDEAPLFYESFLMNVEGRIPYRDFFDFQMPGSYLLFYLFGKLTSFSPFRIRILDLSILIAILFITYMAMQRFGKVPALVAGVLFGLKYLEGGPSLSMQREYLLLLFVSSAVWIGMRDSLTLKHRLGIGILFGLTASIKPHAALGLLPFLLFDIIDLIKQPNSSLLNAATKSILPIAIGFLIPVSLIVLWLASTSALIPFVDIVKNYWPLYSQVNGAMEVHTGWERTLGIFNQLWRLGGNGIWLIPAAFGVYLNRNRHVYLLASLAVCYAVYPALSGQFFSYHYIPFVYCIILLASLSLSTFDLQPSTLYAPPFILHLSPFILLFAVVLINVRPSQAFIRQLESKSIMTSTERATEMVRFLDNNLESGDTVQPLDWTGGTLLAMLESHAPLATSYVFDFYFYHHVSDPYIQSLRADFMRQLQETHPHFMIEVTAIDKPWVSGEDTSRDFPELRTFLNEEYTIVLQKEDYVIYEQNEPK